MWQGIIILVTLKTRSTRSPPWRVPPALLLANSTKLKEMEDADIIHPVHDFKWSSPVVPVIKKNGDIHINADFRELIRLSTESLFKYHQSKISLCNWIAQRFFQLNLDASSGYHQVLIHPDSQPLLMFSSPIGYFCYKCLLFGISSSLEIYQKIMGEILTGLNDVLCFLDDIIISGRSPADHQDKPRRVLDRSKQVGVQLNNAKCHFRQTEISFLGHTINKNGVSSDKIKQLNLKQFPPPLDEKELRSFLGMASFIGQKFVKNFSELTAPLWDLLHSSTFNWTPAANKVFHDVRQTIKTVC